MVCFLSAQCSKRTPQWYIELIEFGCVERVATPEFLMKLSIQLHPSGLSLSNTVRVCELFGVQRARSTVHN